MTFRRPIDIESYAETWYYYLQDSLGNVIALIDDSGAIVETYKYTPFGTPTIKNASGTEIATSSVDNPYMFTGRRWDAETSTYYYRFRNYCPMLGRFMQNDPLGYIDGMNQYAYCGNNPGNWVDPMGLMHAPGTYTGMPDPRACGAFYNLPPVYNSANPWGIPNPGTVFSDFQRQQEIAKLLALISMLEFSRLDDAAIFGLDLCHFFTSCEGVEYGGTIKKCDGKYRVSSFIRGTGPGEGNRGYVNPIPDGDIAVFHSHTNRTGRANPFSVDGDVPYVDRNNIDLLMIDSDYRIFLLRGREGYEREFDGRWRPWWTYPKDTF
ncbi:MAG: RHS repeat-associated core domain-containing protein [Phycisphaerae bacterium]|nr:RHS repeat-associated core domain-containing protein [Phycisphaerae bacterium]